ncbi:DUF4199 domain-containing protein [Pedobacter rhizosphaerae]|uniref:DUF4199 domain-containing protein n=1 Tax=Pedobacter rhizosphaerae TaxID=390241 RepID=A0A1H9MU30_9SPHI|nr:DUF4199 domain-containing protein [Pedobacter rhizosphaerae]SER27206.1 Protein of unknown function [Pedobacter rhizosphaerae]
MDKSTLISKLSLKNGFMLAAVSVVISIALHLIDPVLIYTSFVAQLGIFVLFIVLLVVVGINIRKEVGGYWTFGEAFKAFLIISLILAITANLYNVILMKFVDPDLPQQAAAAIKEAQVSMMEKFGLGKEEIEEALAKSGNMEEKLEPSFKNILTSFGVSIAMYGVLSLILSAILKKKAPVSFNTQPQVEA